MTNDLAEHLLDLARKEMDRDVAVILLTVAGALFTSPEQTHQLAHLCSDFSARMIQHLERLS